MYTERLTVSWNMTLLYISLTYSRFPCVSFSQCVLRNFTDITILLLFYFCSTFLLIFFHMCITRALHGQWKRASDNEIFFLYFVFKFQIYAEM